LTGYLAPDRRDGHGTRRARHLPRQAEPVMRVVVPTGARRVRALTPHDQHLALRPNGQLEPVGDLDHVAVLALRLTVA
jgi:hypothetical protein